MKKINSYLNRIFIDAMSGMALGLFATLIIGTIMGQAATFFDGRVADYLTYISNIAKSLMGAGIGVGIACKFKSDPLVVVSAAVAGLIGAFPATMTTLNVGAPGNPLSAFIAAYIAIEISSLVSRKTPVDIIVTPVVSIVVGAFVAYWVGPYIADFTKWLGELINWNVEAHPFIGGIILSVSMGIILTLPISSAAIGVMLQLGGLAAGAATIGCCCQMIGFAVMSYRENKVGGLIAQGVGTSMLQMPNIVRHPQVWIPPIISSALLAPISTMVLKMESNAVGSGMGTSGLVGQFSTYSTMVDNGTGTTTVILEIALMHIILPGIITLAICEGMRKMKWIKNGDLKLDL